HPRRRGGSLGPGGDAGPGDGGARRPAAGLRDLLRLPRPGPGTLRRPRSRREPDPGAAPPLPPGRRLRRRRARAGRGGELLPHLHGRARGLRPPMTSDQRPEPPAQQSWEPEIAELRRRLELAHAMGGEENVARQHKAGRLTVRERIARLLDPGSFHETGALAGSATYADGRLVGFRPANFVMGTGRIEGRRVVVGG